MRFFQNLHKDEAGQDLIEYALIAALIAVACVAGLQGVATAINAKLTAIVTSLS